MHEKIPGSELRVFEKSGHLVNLEQPAACHAAMDAFLKHFS
jgi:pimeloyl-ACP methyl ester carboxylesterase